MPNNFLNLPKMRPIPYGKEYPLFTRISIETTKTCTRSCWFCPSEQRGKKAETMSDELYTKIVDELAALKFSGVVQWFYLNEPLLDKKHLARIRQLREACPKVTIHLTTNWDTYHKRPELEQVERMKGLFEAGVNSLNLNDYDHRGYDKVVALASKALDVKVVDHCWQKIGPRKRLLSCGPLPEKIHTWSGYVSEVKDLKSQNGKGKCPRPMRHIVVQYDGRVPLCCAVNSEKTDHIGDVRTKTLVETWNDLPIFKYREKLQRGERSGACEGCTATVAYPHVFRKVKL